jgi:hypothetical protein
MQWEKDQQRQLCWNFLWPRLSLLYIHGKGWLLGDGEAARFLELKGLHRKQGKAACFRLPNDMQIYADMQCETFFAYPWIAQGCPYAWSPQRQRAVDGCLF